GMNRGPFAFGRWLGGLYLLDRYPEYLGEYGFEQHAVRQADEHEPRRVREYGNCLLDGFQRRRVRVLRCRVRRRTLGAQAATYRPLRLDGVSAREGARHVDEHQSLTSARSSITRRAVSSRRARDMAPRSTATFAALPSSTAASRPSRAASR